MPPRPHALPPRAERGEPVLAVRGLAKFVLVALPGALLMWVEWWAFEALTLFVGLLPDAATLLAAHGTMFNAIVIAYMAFTGLNSALCATTGKYVGAFTTPRLTLPWPHPASPELAGTLAPGWRRTLPCSTCCRGSGVVRAG